MVWVTEDQEMARQLALRAIGRGGEARVEWREARVMGETLWPGRAVVRIDELSWQNEGGLRRWAEEDWEPAL